MPLTLTLLRAVLILCALTAVAYALPLPFLPEDVVEETGRLFPEWSRGSGWLGFRVTDEREEPMLPASFEREWHLVNSPIRGVVTDEPARLRLGITARELDRLFESRILKRVHSEPVLSRAEHHEIQLQQQREQQQYQQRQREQQFQQQQRQQQQQQRQQQLREEEYRYSTEIARYQQQQRQQQLREEEYRYSAELARYQQQQYQQQREYSYSAERVRHRPREAASPPPEWAESTRPTLSVPRDSARQRRT